MSTDHKTGIDPDLVAAAKRRLFSQGEKLRSLKEKIDAGTPPFGKDGWMHDWNELAMSSELLKEDLDAILHKGLYP